MRNMKNLIWRALRVAATAALFCAVWTGCNDLGVGGNSDKNGEVDKFLDWLKRDVGFGTFIDNRDGKTYKKVTIGTQTWMAENLNYDVPNNNTDVCYKNSAANCATYGRLYNRNTAMSACPAGWHLADASEWHELWDYLGDGAEKKLKSTSGWTNNANGTNESGFSLLPGGFGTPDGNFYNIGSVGYWWQTNVRNGNDGYCSWVNDDNVDVRNMFDYTDDNLLSVRCVQGPPPPIAIPPIAMVYVHGGTFTMGCTAEQGDDCYSDEKPTHSVTLSSFYIGETEITQGEWRAVMGSNPSYYKGDNLPVTNVNWNEVQTFITALNSATGKKYRLPREAEWEHAARGGNYTNRYKYSGSNNINDVAWYEGNSDDKTHPVGTKQANELGIHDMSGNVFEWVNDWYESYSSSAVTNPMGPTSGLFRITRGGSNSENTGALYCRVSSRNWNDPNDRYIDTGFRLALDP